MLNFFYENAQTEYTKQKQLNRITTKMEPCQ